MNYINNIEYDDLNISLEIGDLEINIIYIHYEAPRSNWIEKNHSHSTYELHFISKGHGILSIDDKKYEIGPNTFYLTGPNIMHSQMSIPEDPMDEYSLNFCINKKRSNSHRKIIEEHELLGNVLCDTKVWFGDDGKGCISLFEKIFHELKNKPLGYYSMVTNYIFQILIIVSRYYTSNISVDYKIPHKSLYEKRIVTLDYALKMNFDKNIKITEVAKELGLSVRQLQRIVFEHYGKSYKRVLIGNRVEYAKKLISSTNMPLNEVATLTGFDDYAHFTYMFKKETGYSPSSWKKKFKEDVN